MITFTTGDIFSSSAQVLTNTINVVGVMGAGIALEFKRRYPAMFEDYARRCGDGQVRPGEPYLWEDDQVQILNFPTKRHWKNPSQLSDIEDGLKYLVANYQRMGIYTLALPPLGCGNGRLNWSQVRPLIEKHLGSLLDLEVVVYEPAVASVMPGDHTDTKADPSADHRGIAAQPEL